MKLEENDWDKLYDENNKELKAIIGSYKAIAKRYLTQNLLKTMAKDFQFMALLCLLCIQGTKIDVEKYLEDCVILGANFESSREHELIENLLTCIGEGQPDIDTFIGHIATYK